MTKEKAGQLLSENMNTLYMWSLSKTEDTYKAEDLCSEIVIEVLKSAERLRCDDAFFGFLWQVASNVYKLSLRKSKKHNYSELVENIKDECDFTEELFELEEANSLRRELSILSNEYRNCTVSYYYDNLSCKEISEKYGISCEMVKYYLFKSRKILKEGIAMERQFGEKSFNPAVFHLETVYSGSENYVYNILFNRKLPGQILLTAYYKPITVEQLSVELGVASVYLEDELEVLEKFEFIKKENKKYITNIIILTKAFEASLHQKLSTELNSELTDILNCLKSKLVEIRRIGFDGCQLDDMTLLWDMYAFITMRATWHNDKGAGKWKTLYDKTTGIHYGCDFKSAEKNPRYSYYTFAGQSICDNGIKTTYIGWKGLTSHMNYSKLVDENYLKEIFGIKFPAFTRDEIQLLQALLADEQEAMNKLVGKACEISTNLLIEHSPEHLEEQINIQYPCFNVWSNVGWYGGAALDTGVLVDPDDEDAIVGIYGYKD